MQTILLSIMASVIITKIISTYYFKVIDTYVEDMCEMTKKAYEDIKATLERMK